MNIIIFDFEVYKYDTLLGALEVRPEGNKVYQTWDPTDMQLYYQQHSNDVWIGHNNSTYDNWILDAVMNNKNPYERSKKIIEGKERLWNSPFPQYNFDLMGVCKVSLKVMEAYCGKNIHETDVDFNLDRYLTDEEKRSEEAYNKDDLLQTYDDFVFGYDNFALRLGVIKEFKLPLKKALGWTGTRLAEEVLHAQKTPGIENWVVKPKLYPQLRVKNQAVIDYYLNDKFRTNEKLTVTLCGVEHKLGAGGIHGAKEKYYCANALYFDVSGYYNLVMLNYDLLPRSIPDEYKKLYEYMYHEQLRLKKIDPAKRGVYKTILLSVFGAMMNPHCRFYDPYNGLLVTITGQLFLVDLLEKLEGKIEVIQSNTDGVIAELLPGHTREEVIAIIDEWQQRTGFVLKVEDIHDVYQRDVNNYLYKDDTEWVHTLGEAVKDYGKWEFPFWRSSCAAKEPFILAYCIVNFLLEGKSPEETVEENKRSLRMFQKIAKKQSYEWLEYEETFVDGHVEVTTVQTVNRVFAKKPGDSWGMVYQRKSSGRTTKAKVTCAPDSCFIYNDEILSEEAVNKLVNEIDYDWYVKRAYEKINAFLGEAV